MAAKYRAGLGGNMALLLEDPVMPEVLEVDPAGDAEKFLLEHGLSDTHWGRIIVGAERRGYFTDSETSKAHSWVTCACGKLGDGILRRSDNSPADLQLSILGSDFYNMVVDGLFLPAAGTLYEIETRAVQVIRGGK